MEEDIKILKEERDKLYGELECDAYDGDEEMTQHFTAKYNALNNILNRLEQDERVIEEMAIELNNRDFGFDYGIADEDLYDGIIDHFRKKCE